MKFCIEVQWHYKVFDYAEVEVEADSMEEAQEKALRMAPDITEWCDGDVYDAGYHINEDESYPIPEPLPKEVK